MREGVVALYHSAAAAEVAASDLETARVPSTTIRQFVGDPTTDEGRLKVCSGVQSVEIGL